MDYKLLAIFIGLNIANVIIHTVKSLITIKGTKFQAATANAIAFGLYTVVLVYMVCDLPLWQKVVIVGACNFVGVYVVKWCEEKARKDKLWKVEATVPRKRAAELVDHASFLDLSFNYVDIGKYYLFNFYCPTQADSKEVKDLLALHEAKYFVTESKNL